MKRTMNALLPGTPAGLSVVQAVKDMAQGRLTSEALVASCLDQITLRGQAVHAWAQLDIEGALAQARHADRCATRGLLHGVPIGVKDIIDVRGLHTRFNSPIYDRYVADTDAASVAMLRKAGGVILGKTVTTEFANRQRGPTTNPWDGTRTPGGSSQGSAAAVADGQVMLALGTQTSGSVIRPSCYCGVVGYKPSFGEFSRVGVKQQSGSLDTLGFSCRGVADAQLIRAALLGVDYDTSMRAPETLRIMVCRTPAWDQAQEYVRECLEHWAQSLSRHGHRVTDLSLPPALFTDWMDTHRVIANFESARNLAFENTVHGDLLSEKLRLGRIQDGERLPFDAYVQAQHRAAQIRQYLDAKMEDADLLLTLSAPGEAGLGLDETGSAIFNSLWTLSYQPCMTLPAGFGPSGMPLGIQLVGRRFADEALLAGALTVEARMASELAP